MKHHPVMEPFLQNTKIVAADFSNIPILNANSGIVPGRFMPALAKSSVEPDLGELTMQDLYLPNFSVRITQARFHFDVDIRNEQSARNALFGSCFFDQGIMRSYLIGAQKGVESFHGSQNFKYDPHNEFHHRAFANVPYHIIHFSARPEYLLSILPPDENWSKRLQDQLVRDVPMVGERFVPISLLQQRALSNLLHCPLEGPMAALLMEASITQLLVLQLHALYAEKSGSRPATLPKRDLETAHSVREHLRKNFLEEHSLDDLARQFATNTSKLMALFRKTFGTSIFEYLSELRMEYARNLLESENHLVCEVARTLGYKNPNHFSTAFKKHFGINPKQLTVRA